MCSVMGTWVEIHLILQCPLTESWEVFSHFFMVSPHHFSTNNLALPRCCPLPFLGDVGIRRASRSSAAPWRALRDLLRVGEGNAPSRSGSCLNQIFPKTKGLLYYLFVAFSYDSLHGRHFWKLMNIYWILISPDTWLQLALPHAGAGSRFVERNFPLQKRGTDFPP